MTTQTHLSDKEALFEDTMLEETMLENSIATLQQKLSDVDFNIVEHSCLNPIVNIWSIRIQDSDCPLLFSSGKGMSKNAARLEALENFTTRLLTHDFWQNYYFGDEIINSKYVHFPKERWFKPFSNHSWPEGLLDCEKGVNLREFYNPDGELNANHLIDYNSANHQRGICCIPYQCLLTDEIIHFPISLTSNIYSSNGTAVGNDIDEARVKALAEIIEHYVKFKIIAEGISLPDITQNILSRYPKIQTSIKEIELAGYPLLVQDASLKGKYPAVAISLLNPQNQSVKISVGAHPKFEMALEKSLTGLFQEQASGQLIDYPEAGFDMDEIASPNNLESHFTDSNGIVGWSFLNDKADYACIDWDKQHSNDNHLNTTEEFKQLCDLIYTEGNDIFISDFDEMGVHACRIIVPGMSEIYPIDDLVWENNNSGMTVREQILKTNKTTEECEKLIEDLENLNKDDHCLVSELIGMPADADSIFKDLCIAELITILALKTQNNERIQEGCEWLIAFKKTNTYRLKTYQCINTILQLDGMKNYANALKKLYTPATLNNALDLIDGIDVFSLNSSWKMHKTLINAYKKVPSTE